MCGIAGIARGRPGGVDATALARMAAAVRHRGPDGYGFYADDRVGLAHARLRILDLVRGDQPLANEDGRCWITFNGEIYNWRALRDALVAFGHAFRTETDTEVLVHGWEQWGPAMLPRLNGQFAFAIYDRRDGSLFLARDRFGVRPLYYAEAAGDLYFASEAKGLFASGAVEAAPDPVGLDQVFTFWSTRAPRTVFRGVRQIEPGGWARWSDGRLTTGRWFELDFPEARDEPGDALQQLDAVLRDAVAVRMRADVPVGAYLSGGLDSSIVCSLAVGHTPHALRTFSVAFADPALDERAHQQRVADAIGSQHVVQQINARDIADVFPEVVRHAETPLLRTAPAPMYLLARLARERGITVVLTGEGADEVFLGYDIFKEAEVRRFCLRQPGSAVRPRLFDRLYPYLREHGGGGGLWRQFFLEGGPAEDPLFSHQLRFKLAGFTRQLYGDAMRGGPVMPDAAAGLRAELPARFGRWSTTAQAAYLEITILLDGYLLSSQGDRMAMAHGVEGRYPYLDPRVFTLAEALPARSKLRGLRDKDILRRWAAGSIAGQVSSRAKQPYRAPDAQAFFGAGPGSTPDYVDNLLSSNCLRDFGVFDPKAVAGLRRRVETARVLGVREHQAVVAVVSAQIWHQTFFGQSRLPEPLALSGASVIEGEVFSASRTGAIHL